MTPPVLTITLNPAIDLSLDVPTLSPRDFVRATAVRRAAGGKGITVARVLAELDVPAVALYLAGGPDGEVFRSLLADAPFRTLAVPVEGCTRTNIELTPPAGRALKVNQPGPCLTRAAWSAVEERCRRAMRGRKWVVISGSLPPGAPPTAVARLVSAARRAGCRVAVDCEGEPLRRAAARRPDLLKPTRRELAATLGFPLRSRRAVLEAVRSLAPHPDTLAVISNGSAETLAIRGETILRATPPEIDARGPTGAGDSMVAGLVAASLRGLPLDESLALGVACGAACALEPDPVRARRRNIRRLLPRVSVDAVT